MLSAQYEPQGQACMILKIYCLTLIKVLCNFVFLLHICNFYAHDYLFAINFFGKFHNKCKTSNNMDKKWLVIGICGVTCGGKTTLARKCMKFLPNARVISQDDYFLPKDSTKHTIIPELNHINWEILSSLDMDRLYQDIKKITSTDYENQIVISTRRETFDEPTTEIPVTLEDMQVLRFRLSHFNILIVEGFSLFNYEPVEKLCDLKIYVLLSRETCYARRSGRVYDPADVAGYFDKIVWPEHLQQLEEVQQKCRNVVYLYENNLNPLGTIFKHLLLLSSRFQ